MLAMDERKTNEEPLMAPPKMGWFRRLVGRSIPKDMVLTAALSDRGSWIGGMLRLGFDPDAKLRPDGSRLAHLACYATPVEAEAMARALIQFGAGIDALDHQGFTPLGIAIVKRRADVARLWLGAGARVDAVAGGQAPLALALEDFPEFVEFLLEQGARPKAAPILGAWVAACDHVALNEGIRAEGGVRDGTFERLLDSASSLNKAMQAAGIDPASDAGYAFLNRSSELRRRHGPAYDQALMAIRSEMARVELQALIDKAPNRPKRSL